LPDILPAPFIDAQQIDWGEDASITKESVTVDRQRLNYANPIITLAYLALAKYGRQYSGC